MRDLAPLHVQLLGPLAVSRAGEAITLPGSRKVRALLAYLSLAERPVSRSQLCELLWDVPNDPRGELRWCLSKVRSIVDEPDRKRVGTDGSAVRLDLSECSVDAREITRATEEGIATRPPERLRALADAVQRRISRWAGDRPQPSFQRLACGPAPPLSRAAMRPCWSILPDRPPATRCLGTSTNGSSWRRLTSMSTRPF